MAKEIDFFGEILTLHKSSYAYGNSLAVKATMEDGESYGTLTVNFPELEITLEGDEQFFNLNMYRGDEMLRVLLAEGIVELREWSCKSGFVNYPLVKWNL